MTTTAKTFLIVAAVLIFIVAAIAVGFFIGQRWNPGFAGNFFPANQNWGRGLYNENLCADGSCTPGNLFQTFGRGMMGRSSFNSNNNFFGGGRGFGMMGSNSGYNAIDGEPLSIDEARTAFEDYLNDLGNEDLEIHEIMVFNQNAYAIIVEESTGLGAMELLVGPQQPSGISGIRPQPYVEYEIRYDGRRCLPCCRILWQLFRCRRC